MSDWLPNDWRSELLKLVQIHKPGDLYDVIVCVRCDDDHPLLRLDNEIGDCSRCGARVQFRPECPPGAKMCIECTVAAYVPQAAEE